MIKVIDNFLQGEELKKLHHLFDDFNIPWYFSSSSIYADKGYYDKDDKKFMFTHKFVHDEKIISDFYPVIEPMISKLKSIIDFNYIYRIKANLYTDQNKHVEHTPHQDLHGLDKKYYTAIYFVNSNNGKTVVKDIKIPSISNTIVLFDGDINHYGITQTDTQTRIVININVSSK